MRKVLREVAVWAVLVMVVFVIYLYFTHTSANDQPQIVYSDLISAIKNEQVEKLTITDKQITTVINGVECSVKIPSVEAFYSDAGADIKDQMTRGVLVVESKQQYFTLMDSINLLFTMAMLGVLIWFMSKKGIGIPGDFGRSRLKPTSSRSKDISFDDVAGAEEEKAELEEVVDFLRDPEKYTRLGAKIPRGILLVGSPGNGKTLLAKAVAGEADVPFFSISGSDFVEMYVGVGASRVRELFEQAKRSKPCIIFIDEIDAVGRQRGSAANGSQDEREQTLNQLLVEMDGFAENDGVIILAATNRPDILDRALLRPGRFDRRVVVDFPDIRGREEILRVHSKGKPLAGDVNLARIAKNTTGYSGADLANLLNEAAILAAKRGHNSITDSDIENANLKVMMGAEKKSRVLSPEEKKLTAYHEAGHAIAARAVDRSQAVSTVSIVPRGRAGGFTMYQPEEDNRMYTSRSEILNRIIVMLGGRVAEAIMLDDISTGASNDIERATQLARSMVAKYGMSAKLGPVSYEESGEMFLGRDAGYAKAYSESTASEIDAEVKAILERQYAETEKILRQYGAQLVKVAELLLEKETITGDEFENCFEAA